jgi:hypothetical protein
MSLLPHCAIPQEAVDSYAPMSDFPVRGRGTPRSSVAVARAVSAWPMAGLPAKRAIVSTRLAEVSVRPELYFSGPSRGLSSVVPLPTMLASLFTSSQDESTEISSRAGVEPSARSGS